jgi:hypothetical protein
VLSADQTRLRLVREDQLQRTVEELLDWYGWIWWHATDSRRTRPGLPDLIAARPSRSGQGAVVPGRVGPGGVVYFLELKTETGRLRPEQERWRDVLTACSEARYRLVRPSSVEDLLDELR